MIKFEKVVLASPEQMGFIVEGMRNPMNSWDKSDSEYETSGYDIVGFDLGENDHSLMQSLSNAGNKPDVNHKNGDKHDNSVKNLEWCTKSENEKHAWKNGLKRDVATKGELHGMHKLSRKDVEYIRENHIRNGGSMKTGRLAKMFSVNPQTITEIVSERIWRSILH